MKVLTAALAAAILAAGSAFAACDDMAKQRPSQSTAETPVIVPGTGA